MTDTHIELIDLQGQLEQHLRLRGMTGSPESIQLGAIWYDPEEEQLEEWGRRLIYRRRPRLMRNPNSTPAIHTENAGCRYSGCAPASREEAVR